MFFGLRVKMLRGYIMKFNASPFDLYQLAGQKIREIQYHLRKSRRPDRPRPIMLCTNAAYYPWKGGSEYVLQTIAEYMTKFYDVYVACPKIGRSFNKYNGVKIFEVSSPQIFQQFVWDLQPDVLFCNMIYSPLNIRNLNFYSTLNCFKVMNPVGGTYKLNENYLKTILQKVGKIFDIYIHVDFTSTDYLRDTKYIPMRKICIIPQGVHLKELKNLPDKNMLLSKYKVDEEDYFICCQNYWQWKNHIELIKIFNKLSEQRLGLILGGFSSFGDGTLEKVKKLIQDNRHIHMLLDLPHEDVMGLMKYSIAHCSRTKVEGPQPNIMLECGFMEVPYLTTSAGQRWVSPQYPHVMVADSEKDFINMMKTLTANSELRRKIGKDGHNYLIKIGATWPEVLQSYEQLFSQEKIKTRSSRISILDQGKQRENRDRWHSLNKGPTNKSCRDRLKSEIIKQDLVRTRIENLFNTSLCTFPPNYRILDVGCGPISYLSRISFNGLKEGVDPFIYPNWVYERYIQKDFHVHVVSFENFVICGSYDVILFYNIPTNIENLERLIANCSKLLASDGITYFVDRLIGTPGSPLRQFENKTYFDDAFKRYGFNITSHVVWLQLPKILSSMGASPIPLYIAKITK